MKELKLNCNIVFGKDALDQLCSIKNKSILIVTDKSMVKFGVTNEIVKRLAGCTIEVFDGVIPDPPIHIITAGINVLRQSKADMIIAVGGGSVIDAAKAIRMIAAKIMERETASWEFIAIPTTSGTGSEATDYSVISNAEKGIKYPLTSEELRPTLAILDPSLTVSVPPSVTGDTGMDVLTHAIEAYVSINANDFTDALCEKAITMVFEYLPKAAKDGSNMLAREKMHIASCMAGIAFNAVGLGVNHGMAHAIGGKFHISHGRSNAMLLPYVIRFNGNLDAVRSDEYSVAAKKYQKIAKMVGLPAGGVRQSVNNLANAVEKMNKALGIPATLADQGVEPAEVERLFDELVKIALADGTTQTNPRPVSPAHIADILKQLKGKNK